MDSSGYEYLHIIGGHLNSRESQEFTDSVKEFTGSVNPSDDSASEWLDPRSRVAIRAVG